MSQDLICEYVALLRAISNVSMEPFRAAMIDLGFADVSSFGMSGNLLFNTSGWEVDELEAVIRARFGTPAIVRTLADMQRIVAEDPCEDSVLFLARAPSDQRRQDFLALDFDEPRPVLRGRTVYFVHPAHVHGKRATFDFEAALGMGTARSARVVKRIAEVMGGGG